MNRRYVRVIERGRHAIAPTIRSGRLTIGTTRATGLPLWKRYEESDTIEYFQGLAGQLGIPYQTLINLYLRDCATSRKRLSVSWRPAGG